MTVERKFDAKSMLGMLRRYEATVGDLFAVVPPLMSRDSVKVADIDGVTLRRISAKDLAEGILMPEEKVEGVELIRVDAAKADRYRLRAGDILMPRMLPRHKYTDYMVVNAEYAEQDLASSHNMVSQPAHRARHRPAALLDHIDGPAPLLVRAARHSRTPNRTDSVQLFVRTAHLSRMQRRDVQPWLSLRNLLDCSVVRSNYLVDTQ